MPVFQTSHGAITVNNWGYQLQGFGGSPLNPSALAALDFDLLVTDFSRDGSDGAMFTVAEVDAMKADAVAVSYISIGEFLGLSFVLESRPGQRMAPQPEH